MFEKILIANRGEIALRVLRACKELGIPTVAVHSTADADAMHVRLADESVCIGPPAARDSYLNIPALLAACEITGADAVHPGYGFLSENARFAEILHEHDIHFIGPKPEHIRLMGDKIEAKRTAKRLGIPVVPGSEGGVASDQEAMSHRGRDRLSGAGEGRGRRRRTRHEGGARRGRACRRARDRARRGQGRVRRRRASISRNISQRPRHIEIQVLGDGQGRAIHLGERDCSLQRRHQKVWEESPSPALNDDRARRDRRDRRQGDARTRISRRRHRRVPLRGRQVLFHRDEHAHPGRASGDRDDHRHRSRPRADPRRRRRPSSTSRRHDVKFHGHAIECRINAENPVSFRPSPGKIVHYHPPGGLGVRVDSAVYQGYTIPPYYDSLVGKLIVHGKTRGECLMRLKRALDEFVVDGIETTLPLFRALVREKDIIDGDYHIHWLEDFLAGGGMDE